MREIKSDLAKYGEVGIESLAKYTTWKVGGTALCYCPNSIKSLLESFSVLKENSWKILGGGSNILFNDAHLRSVILRLNTLEFKAIKELKGQQIYCGAGVTVAELLRFLREKEMSCLEFLAGLPASVGGLVQMNASFNKKSVSDSLVKVIVLDKQYCELREIEAADLNFTYRHSGLDDEIIIGAVFRTKQIDRDELEISISDSLDYRSKVQEWGACTAGCVFKNPDGLSAGKLIDECGLKGKVHGDAMISTKHANFIVNRANAKAGDIIYLIEKIKDTVYQKKGILLEEEIVRVEC